MYIYANYIENVSICITFSNTTHTTFGTYSNNTKTFSAHLRRNIK